MAAEATGGRPVREGLTCTDLGRSGVFLQVARLLVKAVAFPVIALWARFPGWPWPYRLVDLAAVVLPPVRGVRRTRVRLEHCRAEYMVPSGRMATGAVLYLHGGAFVIGGLNTHRRLISRIVTQAGVASLAVEYRKLPGHPVSAAVRDALDGYRHLIALGFAPSDIAIAGDSAGGFLALVTALITQERDLGTPGAVVCLAPLVERNMAGKLAGLADSDDPLFPASALSTIERLMVAAEPDSDALAVLDWFSGASTDDLCAMPPTLIQVSSNEILRPDAEFAALRLAEAGVPVELQLWDNQIHVFQIAADIMPDAAAAVGQISEFIKCQLARTIPAAAPAVEAVA